jgi:hypothetical protein
VGIPGNIDLIVNYDTHNAFTLGDKKLTLALPRVSFARDVPRRLQPMPDIAPGLTIGWLLDGVSAGRIPVARDIAALTAANASLRLSLSQSHRPITRSRCTLLRHDVTRTLEAGQAVRIDGRIRISVAKDPNVGVSYNPAYGRTVSVVHGPLTVRMASADPSSLARLCE